MVQIKAFSYNTNAQYQPSGVYKTKDPDIIKQTIEVKQPSDSGSSFKAKFPDVFNKNMLPYVESDALVRAWNYTPMRFWQNQLNFAVWCATTGCGVSYEDHLSGDIPGFAKSMFMFHVYYQIRRIIFELKAPLPTDQSWNAFDNSMDAKAYEKICAEFNVDKNTDWRQKLDDNGGLGIIFNYITRTGYQPLKGFSYDAHQMSFTEYNKGKLHIDYISQQHRNAWPTFILDKSNDFTRPGVERINESIRTYCWAILGSQSQIKSDILGVGSAFDAQKKFLANTEDAIQSPVDLPSQITRYQNALKYVRTKVDYVFGKANIIKHRVGAGNASADAEDQAIAGAFKNRFCIPLDFELLETHMPFYQAGLGDRLEYELTFNDYNKVINSTDADSSYVISNICLEFDMVTDSELARQIRQQFSGRMAILYDRILRHRKITKKKSDTLWNINSNVPARSMKGILMLFEDPDRTSTEDFVNPNITKVEMTIEGVPNQLYSQGMRQYQQWDEINKYFALTSKRDKETDKVAKDLYFSDTNIAKYLTKRFAVWLDLRSG